MIYLLSSILENREQQVQLKKVECTPSESVASITKKSMCQKPSRLLTTAHGPGTYDTKYKTIGTMGAKWNMQGRSIIVNGKYFEFDAKLFYRTDQH